ncbi:biotin synthase BioB [Advenella sp. RU8]|uniref:biotin synthase BioB n=1 Tax=Advenella sp. RU8 TaxID=3399575 RepID=UPI003AAEFDBE
MNTLTQQSASHQNTKWNITSIVGLFERPFMDLLFQAQQIHRTHHRPNEIQLSSLLSIKTGGCAEDCSYCPQSARYTTEVKAEKLMPLEEVVKVAKIARNNGAQRFCMGAAWRNPKPHQLDEIAKMITAVKGLGLETCVTLGMLEEGQAEQLRDAGLDYYNHNLDTSPEFYGEIITTRTYEDRLKTLESVRKAGLNVCCGGIVGLGESRQERAGLIAQLANLDPYPESVPINNLVKIKGTPLSGNEDLDPFEFIRTIAVARITMPKASVRLSAGREQMTDGIQALCFLAGANSIFYGEKLLTSSNPQVQADQHLLERLNLKATGVNLHP